MSENKFTPGPWSIDGDILLTHADPFDAIPFGRVNISHAFTEDEREANRDLIAAAPCLVEAIQALLPALMSKSAMMDKNDWAAVNKANAAIAKARGES